MQLPIGVFGVQAVPKTLHSIGLASPLRIVPQMQSLWSSMGSVGNTSANTFSAS